MGTPLLAADEANLYSAQKEELIKPLLDRFERQNRYKASLLIGKEDALNVVFNKHSHIFPADFRADCYTGKYMHERCL